MQHATRSNHRLATVCAAALSASLALAGTAQAQISDDVIRVGVMGDMSGPYADNGGPGSVLAARMAIEDFGGKVNGKTVEVLVADDQNKPDVGLNAARGWLDNDKVDAIIGGSGSAIALGIQTLMKEKQKPYLIAGTVTSALTGASCSPMSIQFLVDSYSLPKAGVQGLIAAGVKTFYFITVDYAFGAAMQAESTRFIEAAGGKVLGSVKHPLGGTDFSSYLLQAQASGAKGIIVINAGADVANTLKQAAEFRIAKGGQSLSVFGMTLNSVTAMGQNIAEGLSFTVPFYWNRDEDSRNFSKRFMARHNGVVPTYIQSGVYSAMTHYLKGVQAAGTDAGPAVIAKMKAMPINDLTMKNVSIREDGQVMRPIYPVTVMAPAMSKVKYDYYKVGTPIPAEQAFRPLAEGGCDFIKK
ncbi:MAG: ABC transporter substrate-binding protein [Burkholderiaceae bacterium]|nr:ABC transporter substrate-binding protein [Rhodoferax sp.]